MRLEIEIIPKESFSRLEINNYFISSFIWNILRDTEFERLHDVKTFKYFTFSEILPIDDFNEGVTYKLFISSPNEILISSLVEKLNSLTEIRLGKHTFSVSNIKDFSLPLRDHWVTSTPIVLYRDNKKNKYFSIERDKDLMFFLERIRENAIKKWRSYFLSMDFNIPRNLFNKIIFKRTVVKKLRKNRKDFIVIGTMAEFFLPKIRSKRVKNFYRFIMDTGLGEKNSFGFGFINPLSK